MNVTSLDAYFNASPYTWIDIVEHEERLGELHCYISAAADIRLLQGSDADLRGIHDPLNGGFYLLTVVRRVVRLAKRLIDLHPPAGRLLADADPREYLCHLYQCEFYAKYDPYYTPLNATPFSTRFRTIFQGCKHFPPDLLDAVTEVLVSTEREKEGDWWNDDEEELARFDPAGKTAARILGQFLAYCASCIETHIAPSQEDPDAVWCSMVNPGYVPPELVDEGFL